MTSIAHGICIYGVKFIKYWNRQPYGNLILWPVVNFSLESYSNLKLKLVFAIHCYSCTISMLSSSWINVLKGETLHCQMMYQLEYWYTSFGRCHRWNPFSDTWILWPHRSVSWWLQLQVDSILMVWISSIVEIINLMKKIALGIRGMPPPQFCDVTKLVIIHKNT
jgi:hypothetical protein